MGAMWAIASAIIFGLTHVALRRGLETLDVVFGLVIEVLVATLAVGLAAVFLEGFEVISAASATALFFLAAAGLVHFLIGWGLLNASTQLIGAARMSALASTSPFFATILAIFFLQERPNVTIGLGTVLVVTGIWLTLRE